MDNTMWVATMKEKPHYGKVREKDHRFYLYDEQKTCNVGDTVQDYETRPLSKKSGGDSLILLKSEVNHDTTGIKMSVAI
jgi:hypothetical protein